MPLCLLSKPLLLFGASKAISLVRSVLVVQSRFASCNYGVQDSISIGPRHCRMPLASQSWLKTNVNKTNKTSNNFRVRITYKHKKHTPQAKTVIFSSLLSRLPQKKNNDSYLFKSNQIYASEIYGTDKKRSTYASYKYQQLNTV